MSDASASENPVKLRRPLLVTGHPRSGTGYLAQLLRAFGLSIGHERLEEHGISSWMFAAITDSVPHGFDGVSRKRCEFDYVVHVVRHPLPTIASTAFTELQNAESQRFLRRFVVLGASAGLIERACRSYLGWNKLIDAQAPDLRVRVEDATSVIPEFLKARGLWRSSIEPAQLPAQNYNGRTHRHLSADEVRGSVPGALWEELVEYSRSSGYEIEP